MEKIKTAILGWTDISLGAAEGGGYNLVALEHARFLIREGHEVFYLKSGLEYTLAWAFGLPSPPRIRRDSPRDGIRRYTLWNSRNRAPALNNFPRLKAQIYSPVQNALVLGWLKRHRISQVFIHSLEGQSLSLIPAMKEAGLKVTVFCHDHFYICPRVSLLYGGRSLCLDNKGGLRCSGCQSVGDIYRYERYRVIKRLQKKLSLPGRSPRPLPVERSFPPATPQANARLMRSLGTERDSRSWGRRNESAIQALDRADRVAAPSRFLGDTLLASGLEKDKLRILPIGLPHLTRLKKEAPRHVVSREPGGPVRFGYRGGLHYHKGLTMLLTVLTRLPEEYARASRFLIWGAGEENLLDNFKLPPGLVELHPPYAPEDLASHIPLYDVGLMTHLWFENAPISLQEHLASGKPVLSPRLGGVEDKLVPGVNGWFYTPGDEDDLLARLMDIIGSPEENPRNWDYAPPGANEFFSALGE